MASIQVCLFDLLRKCIWKNTGEKSHPFWNDPNATLKNQDNLEYLDYLKIGIHDIKIRNK